MKKLLFLIDNCKKIIYRVSEADTIFDICDKLNVAPQKIIKLNNLKSEPQINSLLYVLKDVQTKKYQVMPNDSLSAICNKFGVKEEYILKQNNIDYIFPFQIIEI